MSNRIKIYADVDGTLATPPYGPHVSAELSVRCYNLVIHWNPEVIQRLAALSRNPSIEWWWLTAWGQDAVELLDPLWGIESAGVIDWSEPVGDYSHFSKRLAVVDDQALDPTAFIWMDDLALKNLTPDLGLFRGDALLVPVNEHVGVTVTDVRGIEDFVSRWS